MPTQVAGLSGVRAIAAGDYHSLAVKDDGTVWQWGFWQIPLRWGDSVYWLNCYVGDAEAVGLAGVMSISARSEHGMALGNDGTVWAWGANVGNYLGTGTYSALVPPTMVLGIAGVAGVAAGEQVIAAVDCLGDLWHWGMSYPGSSPAILYPIGEPRRVTVF